jgi:L-rhamnose mutarotase
MRWWHTMAEVSLVKFRFKPGQKQAWLEWCRELRRRHAEVLETLRNEGVSVEACFLSPNEDCGYYFLEVEDFEKAWEAFRKSPFPLDHEHKQRRQSSIEEVEKMECLMYFQNK